MTTIIKFLVAIILGLISQIAGAQEITGDWNGVLKASGAELPIEINIKKNDGNYTAVLKSPSQTNTEIPADVTSFENQILTIEVASKMVKYQGKLENNVIKGTFTQAGNDVFLNLTPGKAIVKTSKRRPQDPVKPYPYLSEDVIFINKNANNIKLAGTLTLPKSIEKPPVVILISGSGPQNRNEEFVNHRPFLVLSDYLTRQGIAVLRYDERGVGESEGEYNGGTSFDFSTDVEAAIEFLKKRKDIDVKKIGLIGHSEGGFIAPMVASRNTDVAFIVSLAGTGVIGKKVLLTQAKRMLEQLGASKEYIELDEKSRDIIFSVIQQESSKETIVTRSEEELKKYGEALSEEKQKLFRSLPLNQLISVFSESVWMQYFIRTDPDQFLSKVTVPLLAINGSKDSQVLPKLNLKGFKEGLSKAGNKDVTIKELDGLNHLFQIAETGAGSEYENIEETFNTEAMKVVGDWIRKRF
ncbi:alpha/beta hydrolase family protein [Aquimarina sp. 2201CG14-23]|uniref:alpha/beta hydrolase family protein n=1 Tax=Aquimarina mycalae TaxID=3040073 RepID=UPI002477F355|nr:alpha/beta fold hydrolase [Aquimarina sp. 2201CG14-23]MDH7444636.1 alpha/beta fold hydrolase [Aquimarina sp. 2201CG14-23]